MAEPSTPLSPEDPALRAAYEAESRTRCARGGSAYCVLAMGMILLFAPLDGARFGELAGSLMQIRLAVIVALGGILLLLNSPPGRRHPRPVAFLAPIVIGVMQNGMALATGGATSPVNANTSFAILGMAFLIAWPPLWSAFASLLIVAGFVGVQAAATGTAARLQFADNLLLFTLVGALTVVMTAVRERSRWREFQQRWALAAAGREVAASAERYRSVVDTAGSVIVVLSPEGRITELNREAERVLGWPREEACGRDFLSLCVPEPHRAALAAHMARALTASSPRGFEARVAGRDGHESALVCNASRLADAAGRASGVVLCAQDVSAHMQVEAALRQSEARLYAVIGKTPIVLFTLDRAGVITLSEGKGLERLGLKPGELVGRRVSEVVVALRSSTRNTDYYERALAGEALTYVGSNDTASFECSLTPMHGAGGQVVGVIGLALDVTERKQAEDARLALERQLLEAQKLESLGVLAAGVAHDFNNLLASILGSASLTEADLPPDSPARQHLERIELAARRGSDLTRQMLAYAGRGETTLALVAVNTVVEEMRDLLEVSLQRRVSVRYELSGDVPTIEADATQLRQVVMNLVINAAEAIGDADGTVTVRTGVVDLDAVELGDLHHGPDAAPGPHLFLEVADTGCGMDTATATRILDPFFSTKFAGRGLGLATVAGIVRRHGGALGVRSAPGEGTTFRILLPYGERPARADAAPGAAVPEARSDGRTVLLVDDEEDVRAVTSHMLERLGCRVLVAGDGREAVDVFRAHARVIDAVLIDMTLPRMSGEQAAREIQGIRADAPVILMSGYGEESTTRELAEAGPAAFLRKPFSVADLRSTMGRALAARGDASA